MGAGEVAVCLAVVAATLLGLLAASFLLLPWFWVRALASAVRSAVVRAADDGDARFIAAAVRDAVRDALEEREEREERRRSGGE